MFILGYYFSEDMGNKIPNEDVLKKLEADVDMSKVKEIKIYEGTSKSNKIDLLTTVLAKALVAFYEKEKMEGKDTAYLVYTNKYQMSALSKVTDSDEETSALCKKFDGMEPLHVEVVYAA